MFNRLLIGEKLEISPTNITGLIIGGHGHNNLPLWNSITVGGIHLLSENPSIGNASDRENWSELHTKVNQREEEINKIKGLLTNHILILIFIIQRNRNLVNINVNK